MLKCKKKFFCFFLTVKIFLWTVICQMFFLKCLNKVMNYQDHLNVLVSVVCWIGFSISWTHTAHKTRDLKKIMDQWMWKLFHTLTVFVWFIIIFSLTIITHSKVGHIITLKCIHNNKSAKQMMQDLYSDSSFFRYIFINIYNYFDYIIFLVNVWSQFSILYLISC